MPGYGFAKAPKEVIRKWRFLVNDYLRGRQVLKRTLLLIDARHGIKDVDRDIMKMLDEAAVSYRIAITKADKVKASDLAETRSEEHTSELQSLMRISYAVFCLKKKKNEHNDNKSVT